MKTGALGRMLCGLLMILFLGSSEQSCEDSNVNGVITITNNSRHNYLVCVDDGASFLLVSGWFREEGGLSSGWHTVKWYTDYEPHYWVGSASVELVGDFDSKSVTITD